MNELDLLEQSALEKARSGAALVCRFVGLGGCEGICDFVVAVDGGRAVVLLSERADNRGTSITNWFENLATGIYRQHLSWLPPDSVKWLERYPAEARIGAKETLDRVHLEWDGEVFKRPRWLHVDFDAQRGRAVAGF